MASFHELGTRVIYLTIRGNEHDEREFTIECEFEDGFLHDNATGPGTVKSFFLQHHRGNEGQCWADVNESIIHIRTDRIVNVDDVLLDIDNVQCEYNTEMKPCRDVEDVINALREADPDGLIFRTVVRITKIVYEPSEDSVFPYVISRNFIDGVGDGWEQMLESMHLVDDSHINFDDIPYNDLEDSIPGPAYGPYGNGAMLSQ
jgi:hypothetical protein